MDLPPWYDDQGYESSFAYESEYYTNDNLLGDFSFHYGRDILEEDALNEKACMQVLKIWIDKADEDIMQLEEDILMLQCHQLAWDDEQWSNKCSAALREKISRLDLLMESLKKDDRENGLQSETEELPPRLHDLLKPLLESYLAKSKQTETETGIIQTPAPAAVEPSNKKSKEKFGVFKTYERKSKSIELEERRISLSQQEKNAVIRNLEASGKMGTNDELSEKVTNKASALEGSRMLNLVPIKLEPVESLVIDSSSVASIENEKKRNNDSKAITGIIIVKGSIRHVIKVTKEETGSQVSGTVEGHCLKPQAEASSDVQKARVYKRASNKNMPLTKPSVKMKGKSAKIPQTPEAVEDDRAEQVKKPRVESEHQIQVQQKCKECQQVLQRPSSENLIEQNQEIETRKIASEVTESPISLPGEEKIPPLNSQVSKEREGGKTSVMKLVKMEYDASNSTAEEAMESEKNSPQLSLPFMKSKEKLTLPDLRAIAKSRKLRHYYKLRKEELITRLGLE